MDKKPITADYLTSLHKECLNLGMEPIPFRKRSLVATQKTFELSRERKLCDNFTDEEMKKALSTGFLKNMWVYNVGVVDCYVDRYAIPRIKLSDTLEYRIVW